MLLILAGLAVSAPSAAVAKDHDDDHGNKHGDKHWKDQGDMDRDRHRTYSEICFRDDHLRVIHDYYRPRSLPPGLQKKLYRTGQLPPGWEKRIQPFPVVVERELPRLPPDCARGYMDGYAIVYQPRSRVIVDIHAVFTP
jgi:hypothetical protein